MIYDIILAAPPWRFETWSDKGKDRAAEKYYQTMTTAELNRLIVPAAGNAILFMWAIWPMLPDALELINAWGFEYKTIAWVWLKSNRSGVGFFTGLGYYTRANTEPCLLATRGKPLRPENKGVQSVIYAPVMEHSRKPDDQYRKIETLYPGKRYLEMFARRTRPGWHVWGNEVLSDVSVTAA